MLNINYHAEHTISEFHQSDAIVRGIMGPIGSGKSVGCCMEILSRSMRQLPDSQGVRRTRWAIIRNTYPMLKSTTINTWKEWIPEQICPITFGSPIEARLKTRLPDKTVMDMHVYFIALDRPKDIGKLLSLELTGAWLNEAREMDKVIAQAALSRTGRFPPKRDCEITWSGLIMDTNPPDDDHWWYRLAEDVQPKGWRFYKQPGALVPVRDDRGRIATYNANPLAENVENQPLGFQYWIRLTDGADPEWILVNCCGQYGSVFDGKPVYQGSYDDAVHHSPQPLGVFRGLPIFLGFDFGLTPACVIGQVTPTGQLRILRELTCTRGGIKQFATDAVKPLLATLFPNMQVISSGDEAGGQASQADSDLNCFNQLDALGIPTRKAPTNKLLPRRQAVIDRLTRMSDGKPAFLLDPSCKMLRRGFLGGYKFERVQVSGEERYRDIPAKNKFSHCHDGLQYLIMTVDTVQSYDSVVIPPAPHPTWDGMI